MILAIDVGNTHTVIGTFDSNEKLESSWRIRTEKDQTADEFKLNISGLLERRGFSLMDIHGVVLGSVVPSLTEELLEAFSGHKLLVVDHSKKFNFKLNVPFPAQVGADRLINAFAALQEHSPPLLIIDAGTATTFCYINENKEYLGGSILPGLYISAQALFSKASKLVAVDLDFPTSVLGNTTEAALKSGIMLGYSSMIDGLILKYNQEFNSNFKVIATGGIMSVLSKHLNHKIYFDPNLTLKGLIGIWNEN